MKKEESGAGTQGEKCYKRRRYIGYRGVYRERKEFPFSRTSIIECQRHFPTLSRLPVHYLLKHLRRYGHTPDSAVRFNLPQAPQ